MGALIYLGAFSATATVGLADATPSPGVPSPVQICTAQIVSATNTEIAQDLAPGDPSMQEVIREPYSQFDIAKCLFRLKQYIEARTLMLKIAHNMPTGQVESDLLEPPELFHQLALVEERLGLHADAVRHIREAYSLDDRTYDAQRPRVLNDDLDRDYARINFQQIRAAALERSRWNSDSWNILSGDERSVVTRNGGTPTNGLGYPCDTETYDSAGYHEEVWWYGDCDSGAYSSAYTFVNHHLSSTFTP